MNRVMAINDACRPAGRVPAPGMAWGTDPPCESCGGDVFDCTCDQPRESWSADDVRQAIAEADAKRAKAIADARVAQGLAKDRERELRELRAELAAVKARPAPFHPAPVGRPAALVAYLARLEDPPRKAYAEALAAHLCDGADAPAPVDAPWFAKVDQKVRNRAHTRREA